MIRVRRKAGKGAEADPLTGVIERLGSGEKNSFDGPEELLRLMTSALATNDEAAVRGPTIT